MISFPNGKINLGLHITGKRPDGYHEIETLMMPVPLTDILEIVPSGENNFSFEITGLAIPGDQDENLVVKAWRMMKKLFDLPDVRIHLHKVIPVGAGLGGGSSDASDLIKCCNKMYQLDLETLEMEKLAGSLGSDCTFFIQNKPSLATGRGDQLQPVDFSLQDYVVRIVKPDIHIETADAYSWIRPRMKKFEITEIFHMPIDQWKDKLRNDFGEPVFSRFPEIGEIKKKLYDLGAVYASLSGSGSAVFGIFKNEINLANHFPDYFTW